MKKNLLSLFAATITYCASYAQTTILSADFQGTGIPAGWSQTTLATDGGWKFGSALGSSSFAIPAHTKYAASNDDACDCDKSADRLKTSAMDLSSYTKIFMSVDILFYEGTYQGATESANIEVSTDGGTTFNSIMQLTGEADWHSLEIDLSAYAGQPSVIVAFNYNDGVGWTFGCAIDNVKIYEPAALDAGVNSVSMQDYIAINSTQTVAGSLKNYGGSTINSLDLNYSVNGGVPATQSLSGLNITPLAAYNFSLTSTWTPSATGTYSIKVWTSNINMGADQNAANDTMVKTVVVAAQTVAHTCLFEQFTSSTCAPCAAEAPAVNTLLNANNANGVGTNVAVIKYQMNWPSPGNDPSYNPDGNTRKTFYGVSGIPFFAIDGVESNDDQQSLDAATSSPAIMSVDVSYTLSGTGNTVDVSAVVTPFASISAATKLHIAVIEDYYSYPASATSQDDYYFIQRKMLPNGNGSTISPLIESTPKTITQSYTFSVANPPPQNSYNLWVGTGNISVVAFVQETASKKIFQSGVAQSPLLVNEAEINTKVNIYPNPTTGMVYLDVNSKTKETLEVTIMNMLGEIIHQEKFSNTGAMKTFLDLTNFSNGIYSLNIKNSSGGSVTQKLILEK